MEISQFIDPPKVNVENINGYLMNQIVDRYSENKKAETDKKEANIIEPVKINQAMEALETLKI